MRNRPRTDQMVGAAGFMLKAAFDCRTGPDFRRSCQIMSRALAFNPRRDPLILRRSLMHNLRRQEDGTWVWTYDRWRFGAMADDRHGVERRGLPEGLAEVSCPTLVVRGGESDVFHDEDAERLAADLPDGRWVKIPQAGHTVQGDNPKDLIAAPARVSRLSGERCRARLLAGQRLSAAG
jgi:pimeloyl-ACP methyl ester carboxylesterase